MRFDYVIDPDLPVLAWCAVFRQGSEHVQVFVGSRVEVTEDWFVEGAWDGPFAEGGFDYCHALMGSGGKISGDVVKFSTPTHYYEHIITYRSDDYLLVSNSLTFALAVSDDGFDPTYGCELFEFADMRSRGLRKKFATLPTRKGVGLCVHQFSNVIVNKDLEIRHENKVHPPAPVDYASYYAALRGSLKAILDNSTDASRKTGGYRPVAATSQGYDSVAVSAMAKEFGCKEAMTFTNLDPDHRGPDDGGQAVAAQLGMTVSEYDRNTFKQLPGLVHAEFSAHITGAYVPLTVIADQMRGAIWLTGDAGGWVWSVHAYEHISDMQRINEDGSMLVGVSAGEFRLRVGYIHAPIPMIGAVNHRHIYRITHSKEMKPFSLRQTYNRPIPRRIAEEAGVPREMFGQFKMAGMVYIIERRGLTGDSKVDFDRYYAQLDRSLPWRQKTIRSLRSVAYHLEAYLVTKPINRTLRLFHLYPATTHKLPRRWKTKPSQNPDYAFRLGH